MSSTGEYRAYLSLLGLALLPIVAGAHSSLKMPKEAKKRMRAFNGEEPHPEDDEDEGDIDRLTASDAYLFPILGSVVLFSLYLAFTFLDKAMINRILGAYMSLMGVGAVARVGLAVMRLSLGEERWKGLDEWKLSLQKNAEDYTSTSFKGVHVFAVLAATALQVGQQYRPHWILSNITALSFAFNAISLLRLDSFWTGSALLALLFVYDIWWVFGSRVVFGADVMVTVAKSFDAPIKITFPRDLATGTGSTLLGLGDIVLPGIFIALALRYDYHRALAATPPPTPSSRFARPYFTTCFVAYILGLVMTIVVMHTFKSAQPALLYLSPACIGSMCLLACVRREWAGLWAFDDASDDDPKKTLEEKDGEKVEGEKGVVEVGESTSIEVEGQRVLRGRVKK